MTILCSSAQASAAQVIISMAAAMGLQLHACDLAQAFIQADKLPEGVNGLVFIRPLHKYGKDNDVVYKVT